MSYNVTSTPSLQASGALETPFAWTRFRSKSGSTKSQRTNTLVELIALIEQQEAPSKEDLPWLAMGSFGPVKSKKGSFRTNDNMTNVTGAVVDYDDGALTFEQIKDKLNEAGVAAGGYTTARHGRPGHGTHCRLICPTSKPLPRDQRERLVARVCGILGGAGVDDASFTDSQAFYFGRVIDGPPVQTFLVQGRFIDLCDELDEKAIFRGGCQVPRARIEPKEGPDQSDNPEAVAYAVAMMQHAKAKVLAAAQKGQPRTQALYGQAFHLGGYVACKTLDAEAARAALLESADLVGYAGDYGPGEAERHIDNGLIDGTSRPLPWRSPLEEATEDLPDTSLNVELDDAALTLIDGPASEGRKNMASAHVGIEALVGGKPVSRVDPVTARMNERYALVRHAAKTLVAEFAPDGVVFGSIEHLHTFHANDPVPKLNGLGFEPASQRWLRDPKRRQYRGVLFSPGRTQPKGALNLFTGWATEPDPKGSCKRILAHIRDVIAGGNPAHATYIIGWLADIIQNPGRKPGVALVLRGGKGVGKDTLAEIMRRIIGRQHVAHVTRPDALTGRFNAPFATAILVHLEEAFWSGAQDKKGPLQSLITSETQPIERKGIDTIQVESFCRILMTTNDAWAVPATEDERRYAVFDVSSAHRQDESWFGPLYAEINGDGPAAFLAYLLGVDLAGFKVRAVPQTTALRDQKLATLRGLKRWWFEFLHKGDLGEVGDWGEPVEVLRDHLRARYETFLRENRFQGEPANAAQFGQELRGLLTDGEGKVHLGETRPRSGGPGRPRMYALPSLTECRRLFCEWFKSPVDWEEDDTDDLI